MHDIPRKSYIFKRQTNDILYFKSFNAAAPNNFLNLLMKLNLGPADCVSCFLCYIRVYIGIAEFTQFFTVDLLECCDKKELIKQQLFQIIIDFRD